MLREDFGSKFKAGRVAKGWSREMAAVQLGVSFATIRAWETGRSLPRLNEFELICIAFGWDLLRTEGKVMTLTTSRAKPKRTRHQAGGDTPKALELAA